MIVWHYLFSFYLECSCIIFILLLHILLFEIVTTRINLSSNYKPQFPPRTRGELAEIAVVDPKSLSLIRSLAAAVDQREIGNLVRYTSVPVISIIITIIFQLMDFALLPQKKLFFVDYYVN